MCRFFWLCIPLRKYKLCAVPRGMATNWCGRRSGSTRRLSSRATWMTQLQNTTSSNSLQSTRQREWHTTTRFWQYRFFFNLSAVWKTFSAQFVTSLKVKALLHISKNVRTRVANLAFFRSQILKFWLFLKHLGFFGNKKSQTKSGFFWLWLWQNLVWTAYSLQISCDESLWACGMHRILQRFYCCSKNDRCHW